MKTKATGSSLGIREFPKKSGIKIRVVQNTSNGAAFGFSYMVDVPVKITGTIRQRKKFSSEADAEHHAFTVYQGSRTQGADFFALTDHQRREAVAVLPKLEEAGLTLTEAVNFAIEHLRPAGGRKSMAEVAEEVVESKRLRYEQGDLRERSYRDFRHRVDRFGASFTKLPVYEITVDHVKDWLVGLGHKSPRTTRNDLSALAEVFKYAKQKRYLTIDPLDHLSDVDRKSLCGGSNDGREPSILTLIEAEKLLTTAHANPELELLAAVTLGLFCGLRTEEIKRLNWKDIHMEAEQPVVTIGAAIAKKRRIRHVDIPKNALRWLTLAPERTGQVAPNAHTNEYQKRFRQLLKAAGWGHMEGSKWISDWKANALRHSFGSYHYAMTGAPLETSRLLGHTANDQVLFDHYRALTTKSDGEAYFDITPNSTATKVVAFAK